LIAKFKFVSVGAVPYGNKKNHQKQIKRPRTLGFWERMFYGAWFSSAKPTIENPFARRLGEVTQLV
jgi:hypothetical protein